MLAGRLYKYQCIKGENNNCIIKKNLFTTTNMMMTANLYSKCLLTLGMLRRLSKLLWEVFQRHQKLHIYTHLYFCLHTIIAVSVGDPDNSSFPAGSQARCVTGQWPCCWSTCTELVDGLQFTTHGMSHNLLLFILPKQNYACHKN